MQTQSEIETVEVTIEQAKEVIAAKASVEKLLNNRDFKKIIVQGYFKDEAARLTALLNDPQMENRQEVLIADLKAISGLQQYLRHITMTGQIAENEMKDFEEHLDALRAEELEEDAQ